MYPAEGDEAVGVEVREHLLLALHVARVGGARLGGDQHVRDVQHVLRLGNGRLEVTPRCGRPAINRGGQTRPALTAYRWAVFPDHSSECDNMARSD